MPNICCFQLIKWHAHKYFMRLVQKLCLSCTFWSICYPVSLYCLVINNLSLKVKLINSVLWIAPCPSPPDLAVSGGSVLNVPWCSQLLHLHQAKPCVMKSLKVGRQSRKAYLKCWCNMFVTSFRFEYSFCTIQDLFPGYSLVLLS